MSEQADDKNIAEGIKEEVETGNVVGNKHLQDAVDALNDCAGKDREEIFQNIGNAISHILQADAGLTF